MIELDVEQRVLRVHGLVVEIGDRAFDVLSVLAERPGQVVTKRTLLTKAWPGRVVEENNLTVQISALRRVLGPGVIKTVARRGYLLVLQALDSAQARRLQSEVGPNPDHRVRRITRRLVALAQADVAGWSRWLAREHVLAKATWHEASQTLISPSVQDCNGQALHFEPERMLFSFASAAQALEWAVQLQAQLAQWRSESEAGPSNSSVFHLRIGLSVDDMVEDDGKLVGEGLAMVAELQQLARHDDVLVTDYFRALVQPHMPQGCAWQFHGERLLRAQPVQPGHNPRPVGLWQASLGTTALRQDTLLAANTLAPSTVNTVHACSIAVLPFLGANGQAELHFGPGFTANIISALAANRALFVTAHGTTLHYLGSVAEPSRVGAELGVRYLVSGWVRCVGQRLRIGVWLMDTSTAQVLWRENYDGALEEFYAFQEIIALNVAAAVDPHIREAEMERVRSQPPSSFSAYDCLLRALWGLYRFDRPEFDSAGSWLEQAIEQDPQFAQAHAHLAWWLSLRVGQARVSDSPALRERALGLAKHALELAPQDAWCITVLGHLTALFQQRLEQAQALFERALELNPSLAMAWARSGVTLAYLGQGEEALRRVQRAMALSPLDPEAFTFHTASGLACLVAGQPEPAVNWFEQALAMNPGYNASRRYLVAALVQAGRLDQAKRQVQHLLQLAPQFNLRAFSDWTPVRDPHRQPMLQALRQAGVPE